MFCNLKYKSAFEVAVPTLCSKFYPDAVYISGFPRLLESPGIFIGKFPGPGMSWKMIMVLESPRNLLARSS